MMEPIHIEIPGQAVPQMRSQYQRRGNYIHTFVPDRSTNYKELVKILAAESMYGNAPIEGPLVLDVRIYLPITNGWSNKKKAACLAGTMRHTKKPDIDNLLKNLCDGFSKIICKDDAQFVKITAEKFYSDRPRVEIIITPLEEA